VDVAIRRLRELLSTGPHARCTLLYGLPGVGQSLFDLPPNSLINDIRRFPFYVLTG
jgi:hypothetical protein